MLDLHGCNKKKLMDQKLVYKILDELPDMMGVHKVMPPYVIPYEGSNEQGKFDRGGISGVVIIAESHISIHTFQAQGYAFVDIFSCKDFNSDSVIKPLMKAFDAKSCDKTFLTRGKDFPKEVDRTKTLLAKQRDIFR
jgi:S-adenosylmethionine decarboxylase